MWLCRILGCSGNWARDLSHRATGAVLPQLPRLCLCDCGWHRSAVLPFFPGSRTDTGRQAAASSITCHTRSLVPRGLEPRTLRLVAVRSNQLSYETLDNIGWQSFLLRAHDAEGDDMAGTHVSCGVRASAQLPAVDLKSTPLTTRAS